MAGNNTGRARARAAAAAARQERIEAAMGAALDTRAGRAPEPGVAQDPVRGALMSELEAELAVHRPWYDRIVWHPGPAEAERRCQGRHGMLLGVQPADVPAVQAMLRAYFNAHISTRATGHVNEGGWCKELGSGASKSYMIEFVAQNVQGVHADRPWLWCGESMLFEDWHRREDAQRVVRGQIRVGSTVTFQDKGGHGHVGVVAGVRKNAQVVCPGESPARWTVGLEFLTVVR